MISRIAAVALLMTPMPATATNLTLGCSGTVSTSKVPQNSEKETVKHHSVVVDFDQMAVAGFWYDTNGTNSMLPIVGAHAHKITFKADKTVARGTKSIDGSVDRITGATYAMETTSTKNGIVIAIWDLQCWPTRTYSNPSISRAQVIAHRP